MKKFNGIDLKEGTFTIEGGEYDFQVKDLNGNVIYKSDAADKKWTKFTYDENNNLIIKESYDGFWENFSYMKNKLIYNESSDGKYSSYYYKGDFTIKYNGIKGNNLLIKRIIDKDGKVIEIDEVLISKKE